MSLPITLPAAILETIITRLAAFFLAATAGDLTVARDAAAHMLASYHPETPEQACLAANIISCSFQSLEALSQATNPDLSDARILRLRGNGVALGREARKAERRLDQSRKAQQSVQPVAAPRVVSPQPKIEPIPTTVAATAKITGRTWTQTYQDRQRDLRIAAGMKRLEAKQPTQPNTPPGATAIHTTATAIG